MIDRTARCRLALAVVAIVASRTTLRAQIARDSARLAEIVVTAHRDSVAPRLRAPAADLLNRAELARRQVIRLGEALALLPGTGLTVTGAPGGVASTFFRGLNSNHTLLLIDGIRVNDANTPASAFFGGFELGGADRLEMVRGPQSTLHGAAALGGLVAVAQESPGEDRVTAEIGAGRFATYRGGFTANVGRPRWSAVVSGSLVDTDNERPDNQYDQRSQSAAVRFRPRPAVEIGFTGRGLQSSYRSPGDIRGTNTTPVGETTFDHLLATGYLDARLGKRWASRLTLGGQGYFLEGRSRYNGGPEYLSKIHTTRWVIDWQHRVSLAERLVAVGGLTGDWVAVVDQDADRDDRQRAAYGEVTWRPRDDLGITVGARRDDYDSYGGSTTGRVALGWFLPGSRTKLRGTLGSGFLPPSLTARFGGPFQRANPDLEAERSRGWDLGVDQFFAGDRGVVSVTYFGNALRQLIGFEDAPYPELGRAVNVARARTSGLELSSRLAVGRLDARLGYTFLRATDLSAATPAERRLIRRPRHAIGIDLDWASDRWSFGAGARGALDREDTDFNVFPAVRVDPGDYLDASLRAERRVASGVAVRVRLENAFNQRYEEVWGFPALGRRFQMGLSFGAGR